MIDRKPILFGWPQNFAGDLWCATNPRTETTMLCGQKVSSVPDVQPDGIPAHLCPTCRVLLVTEVAPVGRPQESGICPACWGDAPVSRGQIRQHYELVRRGGEEVRGDRLCDGAGLKPEERP